VAVGLAMEGVIDIEFIAHLSEDGDIGGVGSFGGVISFFEACEERSQ